MKDSNSNGSKKIWIMENLSIFLLIFSLCFSSFIYGIIITNFKIFPYDTIRRGFSQLKRIISNKPHHLFPIQFAKTGVTIHDSKKMMPGITLLTSYWQETGWTPGIRLVDEDGNILHHWEIKPEEIWPQSPHTDHAKNSRNFNENYVHGTYLYPNGDIIFNIEYLGLVRMDFHGKILWKLPYRTHHSVFKDEAGYIWVSGLKWIEDGDERTKLFPGMVTPFTEETILKVSQDGNILKEISLLESLFNSDYKHLIWHYKRFRKDVLHINDVEVLGSKLAGDFPLFESGDIVVSSKFLSFIAVLNQTGKIKWLSAGVFTEQHDPDFEQNGWIAVFDNRKGLGISKIRAINPATNKVKQLYPTHHDQFFYTSAGGKHQKLKNGNRLITESRTGRAFEVSPEGEIVWEWIHQPYNEKFIPEILEATRYNFDKKDISVWESQPVYN